MKTADSAKKPLPRGKAREEAERKAQEEKDLSTLGVTPCTTIYDRVPGVMTPKKMENHPPEVYAKLTNGETGGQGRDAGWLTHGEA